MPVHNADVAAIFNTLADLLEIEKANPYRVRAYRNAARTVGDLPKSVETMLKEGEDLSDLPGIGKDLAGKIREIVETGRLQALDEVQRRTGPALAALMEIPGLGPERVRALHEALGVNSIDDLARAAKAGKVRELEGFGKKTEEKILREIERVHGQEARTQWLVAEQMTEPLVEYLRKVKGVKEVEVAGSYRRRKETVGDVDILVACKKDSDVMERFVRYEDVDEVVSQGTTRSTVRLRSGLQVDVRVVPEVSYGAALHYFTGSKAHNIAVRTIAGKKRYKLNEYGLFKGEKRVAGRTEEEVFSKLGLAYVPPELRENRGEIEAAHEDALPHLIALKDIRGDLHVHTTATDGRSTPKEMALAAQELGYQYLAIADHTQSLTVTKGLDAKRLREQMQEIEELNDELDGLTVLKSAEVDIREDGSLDLPNDVLKELDVTTCSVHSHFTLSREKQTARILRAMDNPHFTILGHPSGRLIGEREPYDIDMERLIAAAAERGCVLELNAQPQRLDLTDTYCKLAKDAGVKVAISTDAHTTTGLHHMRLGIGQARRGWLEAGDVLNTRTLKQLTKFLTSR